MRKQKKAWKRVYRRKSPLEIPDDRQDCICYNNSRFRKLMREIDSECDQDLVPNDG